MCQLAIEKLAKGLYVLYIDDNVPRTHNIRDLMNKFVHSLPEPVSDERSSLFEDLTFYYLNCWYTDYKTILNEQLNSQKATFFYNTTVEAFEWLLAMKP